MHTDFAYIFNNW